MAGLTVNESSGLFRNLSRWAPAKLGPLGQLSVSRSQVMKPVLGPPWPWSGPLSGPWGSSPDIPASGGCEAGCHPSRFTEKLKSGPLYVCVWERYGETEVVCVQACVRLLDSGMVYKLDQHVAAKPLLNNMFSILSAVLDVLCVFVYVCLCVCVCVCGCDCNRNP